MELPEMECPICKKTMEIKSCVEVKKTNSFDDCLRKCSNCEVAYSNGKTNPTLIYKDYKKNIPAGYIEGLEIVIDSAFNKTNRKNKKCKFAYISSEDALTWTMFRYYQIENKLSSIFKKITGKETTNDLDIYFWGVSLDKNGKHINSEKTDKLKKFLIDDINEKENYLSEPDIILEDKNAILFFEVKFKSDNAEEYYNDKWDKYYSNKYFNELDFKDLKEYQLIRNWFIGNRLKDKKKKNFYLINLRFEDKTELEKCHQKLNKFQDCIRVNDNAKFLILNWKDIFNVDNLPEDLKNWLDIRILKCKEEKKFKD